MLKRVKHDGSANWKGPNLTKALITIGRYEPKVVTAHKGDFQDFLNFP